MYYFLDTLIQKIFLQIINMYIFRGELTDISAKKEALTVIAELSTCVFMSFAIAGTVGGIYTKIPE